MLWFVIEGVRPYDGRYPFDGEFNTREWGWIKRCSGYLPLTVDEGMAGGDAELMTVYALITVYRAGKLAAADFADAFERLADMRDARVRLESDGADDEERDEDDAGPPDVSNANGATSGHDSNESSGLSTVTPSGSGTPDSDSSGLAPDKWVT